MCLCVFVCAYVRHSSRRTNDDDDVVLCVLRRRCRRLCELCVFVCVRVNDSMPRDMYTSAHKQFGCSSFVACFVRLASWNIRLLRHGVCVCFRACAFWRVVLRA